MYLLRNSVHTTRKHRQQGRAPAHVAIIFSEQHPPTWPMHISSCISHVHMLCNYPPVHQHEAFYCNRIYYSEILIWVSIFRVYDQTMPREFFFVSRKPHQTHNALSKRPEKWAWCLFPGTLTGSHKQVPAYNKSQSCV